jgi:hypothetical protein
MMDSIRCDDPRHSGWRCSAAGLGQDLIVALYAIGDVQGCNEELGACFGHCIFRRIAIVSGCRRSGQSWS